ncbi:DUF6339 family protein [Streptomyces sp. 8N706]|uniref:DUF6339 family protein n=1 Tax=Streptomyces sp. 8N706 TaxID=3457416 RepID=UPI003FD27F12
MAGIRGEGPEHLALLPGTVAVKYLTHSVLSGHEEPPKVALLRASKPMSDAGARWQAGAVRGLVEEAMRRFRDARTHADAWLAPRLHATIRMTRAEASDPELWNFVALAVAPDYVVWRHKATSKKSGLSPAATADRFTGPHYKHAFARLWWVAELFRDGGDYRSAEFACGNQDVLNTTLRLDVIDHRPTALAIVRVLEKLALAGTPLLGDHANALSSAVNVAGSTLMYDVIAPDLPPDLHELQKWIHEAEVDPDVPWESLPDGPDDGRIPRSSVDTLVSQFEKLLDGVSIRQRKPKDEEARTAKGVSLSKPGK